MTPQENNSDDCLVSDLTCSQSLYSTTITVLLYVLGALLTMITVFGNLLVIVSICHFQQLHKPTNVLICSLAMSDLMVGVFVLPGRVLVMASGSLFKPVFCSLLNVANLNACFVSIYSISIIAIDRYLALNNPFLYTKEISLLLTLIVTALIWIVSLVYNFAFLYFNGNFSITSSNRCIPLMDKIWLTVDLVVAFILPCLTIILLYMRIFFIARKHIVAIRLTQRDRNGTDSRNKWESTRSERKAGRALGIVVLVFFACLIPYFICSLTCDFNPQSNSIGVIITTIIFYLNSAINPVIYALFYPWFKNSVRMILSLGICRAGSSLANVLSRDS